jgi:hypothetical protein
MGNGLGGHDGRMIAPVGGRVKGVRGQRLQTRFLSENGFVVVDVDPKACYTEAVLWPFLWGVKRLRKWWLWVCVVCLVACVAPPGEPPTLELTSPEGEVEVTQGERVLIQTISRDPRGVVKVELWVDGRLYEVKRAESAGGAQSLDMIHIWEATTLGEHTLTLKAFNVDAQVSSPVSTTVRVISPLPTPTPTPTLAITPAVDTSCEPSARFVEDVTVPDDSLYNSGVNFTKTWRLRNDGECTWQPGTKWAFISGDLLGAQSPVDVELAEPGRIVEISVEMEAPPSPGTYKSYWRMQGPDGEFFGDQAYVRIIVP